MKTLVVYFSRTGYAKELAKVLSGAMDADCEELVDVRTYNGPIGFVRGCVKSIRKSLTHICPPKYQPREYDRVILVSPVWAGVAVPAIRSYVDQYGDMCKKILLFTVSRKDSADPVKEDLEKSFSVIIENAVGFTAAQLDKGDVLGQMREMSARNG
jgi:flavodoxin